VGTALLINIWIALSVTHLNAPSARIEGMRRLGYPIFEAFLALLVMIGAGMALLFSIIQGLFR
jgi:hypothetical protein